MEGNYAYIIGSASRDNDGYFFVVDTTDPFNPVIAGNATLSFRQLDSVTMQYYSKTTNTCKFISNTFNFFYLPF